MAVSCCQEMVLSLVTPTKVFVSVRFSPMMVPDNIILSISLKLNAHYNLLTEQFCFIHQISYCNYSMTLARINVLIQCFLDLA